MCFWLLLHSRFHGNRRRIGCDVRGSGDIFVDQRTRRGCMSSCSSLSLGRVRRDYNHWWMKKRGNPAVKFIEECGLVWTWPDRRDRTCYMYSVQLINFVRVQYFLVLRVHTHIRMDASSGFSWMLTVHSAVSSRIKTSTNFACALASTEKIN